MGHLNSILSNGQEAQRLPLNGLNRIMPFLGLEESLRIDIVSPNNIKYCSHARKAFPKTSKGLGSSQIWGSTLHTGFLINVSTLDSYWIRESSLKRVCGKDCETRAGPTTIVPSSWWPPPLPFLSPPSQGRQTACVPITQRVPAFIL